MKSALFRFMLALGLGALLVPSLALARIGCEDKSITAGAIRTREDVRAFVRCAYEYVMQNGFAEARRAFNEDERWKSGQFYVFVNGIAPRSEDSLVIVYPPNPSLEGTFWGSLVDNFGSDLVAEFHRYANDFGGGWLYYSFTNPATGREEPKASYLEVIDWDGVPAAIGVGIYQRALPGTCNPEEVSATSVAAEPSPDRLREFVRCAAFLVEAKGYFATIELKSDPRWRDGSIYVFGMDLTGNQFFTGNPLQVNGIDRREWGYDAKDPAGPFGGRDVAGVAKAFGETFLYYRAPDPESGQSQRKVAFVKSVVAQGVPVLLGAGYYLPDATAP